MTEMAVLRRYTCESAAGVVRYYAVALLPGGSTVEVGSATPLSDTEALELARQSLPTEPATTIAVEAEDGTII